MRARVLVSGHNTAIPGLPLGHPGAPQTWSNYTQTGHASAVHVSLRNGGVGDPGGYASPSSPTAAVAPTEPFFFASLAKASPLRHVQQRHDKAFSTASCTAASTATVPGRSCNGGNVWCEGGGSLRHPAGWRSFFMRAGARRYASCRQALQSTSYDVAVVGLGAYGSSVLYHLAKMGLKVIGIERHRPVGHSLGSSHGASRIIRMAYFEGLQYGPLLKRSLRLFRELQDELAALQGDPCEPLFLRTGMLDIGSVFQRALDSARFHGLQHEVLTGADVNRRFPAYRIPEHWSALYQPDGGVLAPERIVQAHVTLAQRMGAEVLEGTAVTGYRVDGDSPGAPVRLSLREATTAPSVPAAGQDGVFVRAREGSRGREAIDGRTITAGSVVLAPGPWIGQLVPELQDLCVPERQVVGWFEIEAGARRHFAPDHFPVFVAEESPGGAAYYGFPEHGELPGFKIGLYRHFREEIRNPADVDAVRRSADAADEAALRSGVAAYFPAAAAGKMLAASTCLFTNTPDGNFLVDRHPRSPQVILCSSCSGHGFKMSSGIGQLIARMASATLSSPSPSSPSLPSAPSSSPAAPPLSSTANHPGQPGSTAAVSKEDSAWDELASFRFDVERLGHRETISRFS